MAKNNNRARGSRNADFGVMEMAREKPFAAAAAAAGAAAAGLFLWSKRAQISEQLSSLSDQIGQWTESMRDSGEADLAADDDTARLTTTGRQRGSAASGRGRAQAAPTNPQ